ncbi:MAG: hypothetical protein AUI87_01110 [Actinobacteria bacterium 13_1_40CM_3_66_19]|nr:MAG: hypothetical protein AUI87_01110 [Actinobacteria bacterium 13_1_40CM_3_66_19]
MRDVAGVVVAIGLIVFGSAMLVANRRIAGWWSGLYGRPVRTGCFYFYLYVAGPILLIIFGILALVATISKR